MNKWIGIGRLTAEPEISYTQKGQAVARYRLAVDRAFKQEGQPDADFINCVVFGKGAEFVQNYLHKGMKIAVDGRIQTGSYEKDGVKHYTFNIIVTDHEFCEKRDDREDEYTRQERAAIQAEKQNADFAEVQDDDLPF